MKPFGKHVQNCGFPRPCYPVIVGLLSFLGNRVINNKKIIATIEARMRSTRLPGKVLLPVCGKPLLEHMIIRIQDVHKLDGIVIATTSHKADDQIIELKVSMDGSRADSIVDDKLWFTLESSFLSVLLR